MSDKLYLLKYIDGTYKCPACLAQVYFEEGTGKIAFSCEHFIEEEK